MSQQSAPNEKGESKIPVIGGKAVLDGKLLIYL